MTDIEAWRQRRNEASDNAFTRLNLLGQSPVFRKTLRIIERIAGVDATVLIQGETGTGKELAARALHYLSPRHEFPFIPVNCGALPDNLLESELFGHERGAFTDAKRASRGLVAQAEGGTLLLDEVEAMTPRAQVVSAAFPAGSHLSAGRRAARSPAATCASSHRAMWISRSWFAAASFAAICCSASVS